MTQVPFGHSFELGPRVGRHRSLDSQPQSMYDCDYAPLATLSARVTPERDVVIVRAFLLPTVLKLAARLVPMLWLRLAPLATMSARATPGRDVVIVRAFLLPTVLKLATRLVPMLWWWISPLAALLSRATPGRDVVIVRAFLSSGSYGSATSTPSSAPIDSYHSITSL